MISADAALTVRRARTRDVATIRRLVDLYSTERRLLNKATVALYEDVQEFCIAELDGEPVGCGALHVMWDDLAEVRTLAVDPSLRGRGIGAAILERLLEGAREIGIRRVFCLTFETGFFGRYGFEPTVDLQIAPPVQEELLQSSDEGVAEMLDLDRVRPNTLGNTRMLLELDDPE